MGFLRSVVSLSCCALIIFLVPRRADGTGCVLEALEDCMTNEEDRRVDIRNLSIGVLDNGRWAIMGKAEMNLRNISKVTVELIKCASKQEPETCSYFTTVSYKNPCKMFESKNELWSSFVQSSEPPMLCPLKGLYSFENSVMDAEAANKKMPGLEGFYWKAKSVFSVGKKQVSCVRMEFLME
ncbi:hypothetical protein GE061_013876 [Apolygus lucorum]|uniref:MD-2-related lipid-recognition domain-containing protein n=1 Tax=Apolygus lucorum TaxID=248454 RepID=A0A8S9XT24_APOLU|nr:hypothetical protein GE061_013876 [Apolygus lucorum]